MKTLLVYVVLCHELDEMGYISNDFYGVYGTKKEALVRIKDLDDGYIMKHKIKWKK